MTSEKSASPLGSSSDSDFSFTTECRTPELIWNDEMALQFRQAVGEQLDLLHTRQLEDNTARLELDPAHQVEYSALDDEIYIGGIYVRLFLQNPQFDIRRPEKFIEVRSPYCSRDVQPGLTVTLPGQELLDAHGTLSAVEGMAKDLGAVATAMLTVLKVRRHRSSRAARRSPDCRRLCVGAPDPLRSHRQPGAHRSAARRTGAIVPRQHDCGVD